LVEPELARVRQLVVGQRRDQRAVADDEERLAGQPGRADDGELVELHRAVGRGRAGRELDAGFIDDRDVRGRDRLRVGEPGQPREQPSAADLRSGRVSGDLRERRRLELDALALTAAPVRGDHHTQYRPAKARCRGSPSR
jgi:hypothetical protein